MQNGRSCVALSGLALSRDSTQGSGRLRGLRPALCCLALSALRKMRLVHYQINCYRPLVDGTKLAAQLSAWLQNMLNLD